MDDLEKICMEVLNETNMNYYDNATWLNIKKAMWQIVHGRLNGLIRSGVAEGQYYKYTILKSLTDGLYASMKREEDRGPDERDGSKTNMPEEECYRAAEAAINPVLDAISKMDY